MKPIYMLNSIREAATRPEFFRFMTVALKDLLLNAYQMKKSTFQRVVVFQDSSKDKEGYPSLGSSPLPEKVLEGEPYLGANIPKPDFVEVTNFKYGRIIEIADELIKDDQTGKIKDKITDPGSAHKKFEDIQVWKIFTNNDTAYDSQNFFSLNHPGFTGGAAIGSNDNLLTNVTLTANALAEIIGMVGLWTGHTTNDILDVQVTDIIVPVRLKFTADVLAQSSFLPLAYAAGILGPAAAIGQGKNPLSELGLGVIPTPRLDGTSTTDWYVKTDFPSIVFQNREPRGTGGPLPPLVFMERQDAGAYFERDVIRAKTKKRFGLKLVNWRGFAQVS